MNEKRRSSMLGSALLAGIFLLTVSCGSASKTRVVLLPDKDGTTGAVAVSRGQETAVLETPMAAADVGQRGRIETSRLTAEQVRQDFGPALDAQPPEPISFVLYFEEGSTEVLPGSRDTLDRLFDEVSSRQAVEVQITGHTDTVGKTEDNDRLSAERAEAIKQMLMEKGLQAGLIRAVGRGERQLLIPTEDNAAEPKNRRVEVIVR